MRDHLIPIDSIYCSLTCLRLLLQRLETEDYLMLSMLWRFRFCQALKHSDRLIKSKPKAAAPCGSHTEKYSESLIHNQKNERTLWSSPILFLFFQLAPSKKAAGARTLQEKRERKEAYSNCATCIPADSVFPTSVCPFAPLSPEFFQTSCSFITFVL